MFIFVMLFITSVPITQCYAYMYCIPYSLIQIKTYWEKVWSAFMGCADTVGENDTQKRVIYKLVL